MAFHCPNCNGSMVFDVSRQLMRCEHCGCMADPQTYDPHDDAVVMSIITCQNCGAELEGTEDSIVGFCPYCGGQSLVSRPGSPIDVEQIIPFQVSKEQCSDAYAHYTKGIPYLHKEFKDPEQIKKFTGIYMPFYQYDATFGDAKLQGRTSKTIGNYTEVTDYSIEADLKGSYKSGAPFDASKYLDDEISARCMPFDTELQRPFRPAYLAGFYADATTTPAELYYEDAKAQAEQDLIGKIGNQVMEERRIPLSGTPHVDTTITEHHSVLFPLWFLTWRKEDRVAYAVINGQSGQVVSDLPLNLRSFVIGCLGISAAIFALLEVSVQPTPGITAFVSFLAAALMAWGIYASAKRVYETQTHAHDKGWTNRDGLNAKPVAEKRRKFDIWLIVGLLPLIFGGFVFLAGALDSIDVDRAFDARTSALLQAMPLAVLAFSGYVLYKVIRWHRQMREWNAPVAIGVLVLSVLINTVILFIAPVQDMWYYLGDIVCIIGLIGSSVAMLRVYNLSTTRPLPELFDRKEV